MRRGGGSLEAACGWCASVTAIEFGVCWWVSVMGFLIGDGSLLCVCKRERERERDRVCVCECYGH